MNNIIQGGWIIFNDEYGNKGILRTCCIMEARSISENSVLITTIDNKGGRELPGSIEIWINAIEVSMGFHINQYYTIEP